MHIKLLAVLLGLGLSLDAPAANFFAVPDADGNGADNLAARVGNGVQLRDAADPALSNSFDFGDGYTVVDTAAVPDLNGNAVAEIAALGRDAAGRVRIELRDAATGASLPPVRLPSGLSYRALDVIADHDGLGTPLLVAWAVSASGSLHAVLRTPAGAALATAGFGRGLALADTAVIQRGPESRLVLFGSVAATGAGRVIVRRLDGSLDRLIALSPRALPVALTALSLAEPEDTLALLVQDANTDIITVQLRRAADAALLRTLRLETRFQPRALTAIERPGAAPVLAVLIQSPEDARIRLFDAATGALLDTVRLTADRQWRTLAGLADVGASDPGVAVLGEDGAGELSSLSVRLDELSPTSRSYGAPVEAPEILSLSLRPDRDAGLYETADGSIANGSGDHFFVGLNGLSDRRRGLLHFDVASALPRGSRIVGLDLDLHVSRTRSNEQRITVHRLLTSWGEGVSDASGEEGGGAPSANNDATWLHRFFSTLSWRRPGGDFNPQPRAQLDAVPSLNRLAGTPRLQEDVQRWLDVPSGNHGWILIGDEPGGVQAMRFDSRTNPVPSLRPQLAIRYQPPDQPID